MSAHNRNSHDSLPYGSPDVSPIAGPGSDIESPGRDVRLERLRAPELWTSFLNDLHEFPDNDMNYRDSDYYDVMQGVYANPDMDPILMPSDLLEPAAPPACLRQEPCRDCAECRRHFRATSMARNRLMWNHHSDERESGDWERQSAGWRRDPAGYRSLARAAYIPPSTDVYDYDEEDDFVGGVYDNDLLDEEHWPEDNLADRNEIYESLEHARSVVRTQLHNVSWNIRMFRGTMTPEMCEGLEEQLLMEYVPTSRAMLSNQGCGEMLWPTVDSGLIGYPEGYAESVRPLLLRERVLRREWRDMDDQSTVQPIDEGWELRHREYAGEVIPDETWIRYGNWQD